MKPSWRNRFFFFKKKKKKIISRISLESISSFLLSQRKLNSQSFLLKKNSLRFPCRERPCLEEKSPVNVKSHRNVLSGNLNQISGRKMENHTLLDTEIHKARQKLMFLRDFQIYTFISSTFEDNFFKE